jgi:outer membrane protein W
MKTLTFITTVLLGTNAYADTQSIREGAMPAIDGGLEVGFTLGSATSVGEVGGDMAASDLIGTAAQGELKLGTRITPNLAINFYTAAQAVTEGSNTNRDVYSGSAGVMADFHFRPHTKVDPWLGVGGGVAAILVDQDDNSLAVGVELARVQAGVDFRIDEDFSIGPMIGASASLYGAEKTSMHDFEEIDDKGIHWAFSAGLVGRFNAFGARQ